MAKKDKKGDVVVEEKAAEFKKVKFNCNYGECYKKGDVDELPTNKADVLIGSGIAEAA